VPSFLPLHVRRWRERLMGAAASHGGVPTQACDRLESGGGSPQL
jgi:hypothetical protein